MKEHHKDIVTCAEMFFLEYGEYFTEKEKKLVVEACRIHDLGKVNLVFQAMICPKLAEKFYIDVRKTQQIPHGFLSAVTISLDEFDDLSELFSAISVILLFNISTSVSVRFSFKHSSIFFIFFFISLIRSEVNCTFFDFA